VHVVLVGLMGSGKSTVGGPLAARLGWPLRDSDVEIGAARGCSVRELAARLGADAMHEIEADQLLSALGDRASSVITPAASTVDRETCRRALRAAFTVWLDAPVDVLAARFASGPHRPDFGRPVPELLADQLARRGPFYAEVATLTVDATRAATDLVEEIVAALGPASNPA
jgi:shikimate kinase